MNQSLRLTKIFLIAFLAFTTFWSCSNNQATAKSKKDLKVASPPVAHKSPAPNEIAILKTSMGDIQLRFFPEVAPNHVANFKKLARSGFYDGTTFHRVIPGFMIQGGDPNSKDKDRANDGIGGSGINLKAEFNKKSHIRGTLSMARSAHPDSASSQFFICVAPAPHLNGQYTAFGEAITGMDIADKISKVKTDARNNPIDPIVIEKVLIVEQKS